ncbi:MAG: 16S rRNA methyltransferase [Ignisphaera sp.]|nr:16S rRNA methyltransferase [Ignisphaera sp.]MCX8168191.1 16S rRNA methyltransferase [Ignisphaera sp.]MDW8084938.1 16S rRNA methyltransferase [Ignisphaera sp.]
MHPLTIVLAECGLELIPKEIQSHSAIVKSAKRRGKNACDILLDISLHYKAMKLLPKWYKRGRPDIVHISLLLTLSSPLNYAGLLKFYIHTINDVIVHVDAKTRIPRNYNRFVGLMEQLLKTGKIPPNSSRPLMFIEEKTLHQFVQDEYFDEIILFDEKGVKQSLNALGNLVASLMGIGRRVCIIIGGFQRGDFEETTLRLATKRVSVYPKVLEAWIVLSRIIESVENSLNLLDD